MNRRLAAWRFVCGVLSPGEDPAQISLLQDDIQALEGTWPHVIRLADAHRITPAVWASLNRKSLVEYLPEEPRQYIESLYEMNAKRNASLLAQLDEAIRVLNFRGIVPVLLKGAAYLKGDVYENPAARIFADLDLLIDEAAVPLAQEALHEAGYRESAENGMDYARHWHCPPLSRPGEYGSIEIHRRLLSTELGNILPIKAAWSASTEKSECGLRYRQLSPAHMITLSFLHSQIIDRFGETFTIGLRPIQDLAALQRTFKKLIQWDEIYALLKRHGAERHFRDYLFAASRVAGLTVSPEIRFGPREWAHYGIAHARIRWQRVERLNIYEFSSDWIRRHHRNDQKGLSLNYHRLLLTCNVIGRRLEKTLSFRSN